MLTYKKLRVVVLTIFCSAIIFIIYKSNTSSEENQLSLQAQRAESQLTSDTLDKLANQNIENVVKNEEPQIRFDPLKEFKAIRSLAPMTIFSKTYCPFSKRVKALFEKYDITPQPTIVELDKHEHGQELQDYLAEITGRRTVPNVIVGNSLDSRGGADDMEALDGEGILAESLNIWGEKQLDVKKVEAPSNL